MKTKGKLHGRFLKVFWKLQTIFNSTSEKLLVIYIAYPEFQKGVSDQNSNVVKSFGFEGKVKNRRTCCDKFCIPYQEVKGLFRNVLLNRKLFKHGKIRWNNWEIW